MIKYPFLLVLLLFAVSPCFGVDGGVITGCVTAESAGNLPGVAVEISGEALQKPNVIYTNSDGCYQSATLAEGTYTVTFRLQGFQESAKNGVIVFNEREAIVERALKITTQVDVMVVGKRPLRDLVENADNLVGIAETSSEGAVRSEQLALRPLLRPAEMLEAVPGVVISQHSGQGKANQYYVRGFNLDHGTDFAIRIADIPVNFPTHAHGQGYADLNFLIPELVNDIQFKKGTYSAREGDFSSAGAVRIDYTNTIDRPIAGVEGGNFGYGRGLFAASPRVGNGNLLYAVELYHKDGPWEHPENYRKINALLRYSTTNETDYYNLTAMAYAGDWDSTDQIAQRAVPSIGRFGAIDPTDGGKSARYGLSGNWQHSWGGDALTETSGYLFRYRLNLFSNFTYNLDDPVNGDQFEQEDRRWVGGFEARHRWLSDWGNLSSENEAGVQLRSDRIDQVGLFHTKERQRLSTVRQDDVVENNWGFYYENRAQWSHKVRTVAGIRLDQFTFDVDSNLPLNSGDESDSILSPKFSLVLGPWSKTEYYFNFGYGFHSNDARGTTIRVDPETHEPVERVDALVRTTGTEFGIRSAHFKRWQSTFSLWLLDMDSELVFIGDAGNTEAGRPSRRLGFEWSNYVKATPWLTLDTSWASSRARFRDDDTDGDRIPGAIEGVLSAGITIENLGIRKSVLAHTVGVIKNSNSPGGGHQQGAFLPNLIFSVYVRYFGPRPLIEDNSVRSKASTLVNLAAGYKLKSDWNLFLDVFNVLNSKSSDIDYFYASRLPGETAEGIEDIHFHPVEPVSFRLSITKSF